MDSPNADPAFSARRLLLALVAGVTSLAWSVGPASVPQAKGPRPAEMRLAAPISTWDEAVPLGNGLTGGLLWGEGRTLRLSLDRSDLWDLRTPDLYREPDWTYATMQRLVRERNQQELQRRFDDPFEQIPYPTKLPAARLEIILDEGHQVGSFVLDLRRGVGRAEFPRGAAEVFFSAREPVAMMRVEAAVPVVKLVPPAALASLGYAPATVEQAGSAQWLVQDAALNLRYVVYVAARRGSRETELAIAIVTNGDALNPLAVAKARAERALEAGFTRLLAAHTTWWDTFWAASAVELPDPRLQQLYTLAQYFYGAASRRGAPPLPLQGVWTADAGSLPPWKGDYHFDLNVQMTYWAYLAAGRFDEGTALLDFMWALIPAHRQFARQFFATRGIVVPGVMTLDGRPMAGWGQYSLSPVQGAWVAHAFYQHWRYTMDRRFLASRAYPYCMQIAEGLLGLLVPDARGKLKLPLSTSPEIHDNSLAAWMTPMTNYDLAIVRWLFGALEEMASALGRQQDAARWGSLLARMDELAIDPQSGALRLSPDESLQASHRHFSHLMAIHPLGTLSIEGSDRDRSVVMASLDELARLGTSQWVGYSFAWAACLEARAGRGDRAAAYLDAFAKAFVLRNGFHANGDQTRSGYSRFTYRPVTLEGNFAAAQAVHEMLLQSWGGVVRVFPATPATWQDAAFFDLRTEGGLVVSGVRTRGRTVEVRIRATRDQTLRLRDPFEGEVPSWIGPAPTRRGRDYEWRLKRGQQLVGRQVSTPRP